MAFMRSRVRLPSGPPSPSLRSVDGSPSGRQADRHRLFGSPYRHDSRLVHHLRAGFARGLSAVARQIARDCIRETREVRIGLRIREAPLEMSERSRATDALMRTLAGCPARRTTGQTRLTR